MGLLRLVVVLGCASLVLVDSGPARRTTFPGPNGRIAIELAGELYTVNPDGSDRRRLFARSRDLAGYSPAFSPDGTRIAFENRTRPNGGITIMNADGTGRARVTTQEADDDPSWSPDGRQIAFARTSGSRKRLHVVNVDGTGLAVLTPSLDRDVEDPDWSPDGTRIAFSDNADVYVVGADGSGLTLFTGGSETGRAQYPSWSPDANRILYSYLSEVKVMSAGAPGSGTTVIPGLREVWEVAWSPDGTRIALAYDAGGPLQEDLYVANADGSGLTPTGIDTETTVDWGKAAVVPPPVVGVSVNVAPVSGTVRVRVRGTNRFVNLARLRNVPVGSEFDVTRGRVRLTSAAGAGRTQTGVFYQGRGIVQQPRARTPVTTLVVSGPLVCPRRSPAATNAPAPPRTRRLWGNVTGRFSTKGRYASAAVRGTTWLTEDRCDGTLIRVTSGRVQVRDLVLRRTITITAGRSYLARRR